MIEIRSTGSLFDAGTHAIVNTVNCVGVMGKGIALEFKRRYPEMFKRYAELCKHDMIYVGRTWTWENVGCLTPQYIVNFPTKEHWRNPSKLEWIATGLDDLKYRATMIEINSLALPALGCTNGGLRFEDVRALIEEKLNDWEIPVILYEPQ
jgi:O-acetyl-ADP-ribose deacetylase (regulator of RNase III)